MRKLIFLIIAIAILIGIILAVGLKADSIQGEDDALTVTLNTARDSAWVIFSYPDNNAYDSTLCLPAADSVTASRYLVSLEAIDLDSVGCHNIIVRTFTSNTQTADTLIDQWCNFGSIIVEPGSGYKTYPCTLFTGNSADDSPIAGVSVTVRPLGGGTPFALRLTDANGLFYYKSEAESISVYLHKQGVSTNAEDTLVIVGSQTDTILVPLFAPSQPPANQTIIFTWITTPQGDTIYPSYLRYRLVDSSGNHYDMADWITYGTGSNQIVMDIQQNEIEADSSYMEFSLYANENLSDTLSLYEFYAAYKKDGRPYLTAKRAVAVPDAVSFNPFAR